MIQSIHLQLKGGAMYTLDLQSEIPIYKQIVKQTKEMLIRKVLQDGEKMPSIRELASILSINPTTVAKAYEELEREGILVKIQGRGSFISYDEQDKALRVEENLTQLASVFKELKLLGFQNDEIITQMKDILSTLD